MKKIILIYLSIPLISASASNFHERIYNLKNASSRHLSSSYSHPLPSRRVQASIYHKQSNTSQKFFYAMRAAKKNNVKAQLDLAFMYANGQGVQKSERKAFHWFHKAARNNSAKAKHYMGISFLQGRGVRQQPQLAQYWFRLATKQGYTQSVQYLRELEQRLK